MEELAIEHRASRVSPLITVSVGVAVVEPDLRRSPSGAVQLADEALYRAKSNVRRNRLEVMNQAEYRLLVTGIFPRELPR